VYSGIDIPLSAFLFDDFAASFEKEIKGKPLYYITADKKDTELSTQESNIKN
jgi:hypothetical protein